MSVADELVREAGRWVEASRLLDAPDEAPPDPYILAEIAQRGGKVADLKGLTRREKRREFDADGVLIVCGVGHRLTDADRYQHPNGSWRCKLCARDSQARWEREKRRRHEETTG